MSDVTPTVVELVRAQVQCGPDRPAVRWRTESVTYGELWEHAGRIAARLRAHGIRHGDVVGICPRRSGDLVAGILGILRAGCAYLPLDTSYPADRLRYMIDHAGVKVLVGHRDSVAALAGQCTLILFDDPGEWVPQLEDPPSEADDIAYVMFTSGSTGVPKGVMQTHAALSNLIRWQLADSVAGAGDVTVQFAPISFDVSFQEIFATLAAGGLLLCLDDDERRDPVLLWKLMVRGQVNRLYLPFVMLQTLALFVDGLPDGSPPLREVITAGEQLRCDDRIKRLFTSLPGCRLINQYGPTETHVCTRYLLPADPMSWPLLPPIGTAVDGVRLYVLDSAGQPAAAKEPGELHVAGVAVAAGYIGRPDLTEQRFQHEPNGPAVMYATGDVVEWRDGQLHYLGRNDDQIKLSGIRVEPAEIERALLSFPDVREAAVAASKDEWSGTRLMGFVTGDLDSDRIETIRRQMAASLPPHLVPHRIFVVAALPRTPSGKLHRAALLDTVGGRHSTADVSTNTDALVSIWRAELGLADEQVQNLREAGTDSLAAARIAARIAERLGVLVPIEQVLAARSLEHLAEIVAASPVVPGLTDAAAGPRPVTAMQRQIFIDELLRDEGPSHWVLAELDITGPFDAARAELAFQALARRHAALHTRFDFTGPDLSQEYVPDALPVVTQVSGTDLDLLRVRRLADRYELGEVAVPVIDIAQFGEEHHRILFRLHHSCCDGWSIALLFGEFAALYADVPLPPAVQPWHLHAADASDENLEYWLERLAPVASRPPVDWHCPRGQSPVLRRIPVTLVAAEVDTVRKLAKDNQATPFAVLLAAWASLFGEGGEEEVCVAVPVSTRNTAQDARCAGLFLNTVVLLVPSGAESFAVLVERTKNEVGRALRHRNVALPDLLARLEIDRQPGHHPLAQVMFTMQPPGPRAWTLPGGARAELLLDLGLPEATRFDLVLNLDDRGEEITGWIDYDAGAVDKVRVGELIGKWRQALTG